MSPFHVNYRSRLAEVTAALEAARREGRLADAMGLELALRVLGQHVEDVRSGSRLVSA